MLDLAGLEVTRRELLLDVLRSALGTVLFHYGREELEDLWGDRAPVWNSVYARLKDGSLGTLSRDESEACLDALHITQYSLGPTELQTITGSTLREYASVGLLLFDQLCPVYKAVLWSEDGSRL